MNLIIFITIVAGNRSRMACSGCGKELEGAEGEQDKCYQSPV